MRGAPSFVPLGMVLCAIAVAGAPLFPAGASSPPLPLPGPAPQARPEGYDAAAENRACEGCHAEIAAEWRGSLHHAAWDDPVFLTAYAIEPLAFCRGCHAPEADATHTPPEGARRLGVGCVTCHAPSGAVESVSVPQRRAPHPVMGDARLATAAACERCHQFAFPEPQRAAMQGTGDEHRASAYAAWSCQACHMPPAGPEGGKHKSHAFRVAGDAAMLRAAVSARAWREGDRAVRVSLAAARAGHAFPTGDMFRRLVVRARVSDEHGAGEAAAPAVLARRFVMVPGAAGPRRLQVGDDRLPATGEAREVELAFGAPVAGREVRWEVAYQRMEAGMAAAFGVDAAADEVVVAEGTLLPRNQGAR